VRNETYILFLYKTECMLTSDWEPYMSAAETGGVADALAAFGGGA
jgi:hypothetical protein